MASRRSVLVIGANGYIGLAVSRAFVRAGWHVRGLVRRPEATQPLIREEITPIIGVLPDDQGSIVERLLQQKDTDKNKSPSHPDVIVMCTQVTDGYEQHFAEVMSLVQAIYQDVPATPTTTKPLLLWSSGSKDYGFSALHGSPDLRPFTEEGSPISCPDFVAPRAYGSLRILEDAQNNSNGSRRFDVAVLRPTNVYGYSSSYYGYLFDFGAAVAAGVRALTMGTTERDTGGKQQYYYDLPLDPNVITHALHVDDCGDAYVALAEAHFSSTSSSSSPQQQQQQNKIEEGSPVAGQIFNIASWRYETVREVVAALATTYGFPLDRIRYTDPTAAAAITTTTTTSSSSSSAPTSSYDPTAGLILSWSSWLASDKLREVTAAAATTVGPRGGGGGGWTDRRPLFTENMAAYRAAYELAAAEGHPDTVRVRRIREEVFDKVEGL